MTTIAAPSLADQAVPLSLPSILVNPRNKALAQVEAYNAQQREKAAAKRHAASVSSGKVTGSGVGKRTLRRRENATFQSNPFIHPPSKGDLLPSAPPHRPSFPLPAPHNSAKTPLGPAQTGSLFSDPSSSAAGAYTTSLKGVRKTLRGRGRRAETVILRAEAELRDWKGGSGWKVIDDTLVEPAPASSSSSSTEPETQSSYTPSQRRNLPHAPPLSIPPFLQTPHSSTPAITALAQSAAHQIWHVPDAFDRWLVHLLCRYWELVSWSETSGDGLRLTHIVRPEIALVRPNAARRGVGRVPQSGLMTPETTDLSASGTEAALSSTDVETETETEIETEVEGETDTESQAGDTTFRVEQAPASASASALPRLHRTFTTDSEDYLYPASDEGDWSETESLSGALGDSLVLEPVEGAGDGGWQSITAVSPPVHGAGVGSVALEEVRKEDKLSFFDYLYGA